MPASGLAVRALGGALPSAAAIVAPAPPAFAHVEIGPSSAIAGGGGVLHVTLAAPIRTGDGVAGFAPRRPVRRDGA